MAAETCQKNGINRFIYTSAAAGSFLLPSRYLDTKRQAEEKLSKMGFEQLCILLPPLMYSRDRPITLPIAASASITSRLNKIVHGGLDFTGVVAIEPLNVSTVAQAAVEAIIEGEKTQGLLGVDRLKQLAQRYDQ